MDSLERIEKKVDKINEKLDNHLERIAKIESVCDNNKGTIRILITSIVAVVSSTIAIIVRYVTSH